MTKSIIKLDAPVVPFSSKEGVKINRLVASISPSEFVRFLKSADNRVNPRSAKPNAITKSIHETLDISPNLFWYKSKGLLIATESCEFLDRNRVRLSLDDSEHEGIMDGGHTAFAVATFIANRLLGKRFKDWYECKAFWDENYEEITAKLEEKSDEIPNFSIPVEVIFPNEDTGSLDEFYDNIAEICAARNNNAELAASAKANQRGFYDYLKSTLDPEFKVVWKTGDAGQIKAEDVVSMAAVPLLFLQEEGMLPETVGQFSPVSIYSQKSKCVEFYNSVLKDESVSASDKGKAVLSNKLIASSLDLTGDVLRFFDRVFVEFPRLYNAYSPGFGRIRSVDDTKSKPALFRTGTSSKTYPPGFIYPLVVGLTELLEAKSGKVSWVVDPETIDLDDLNLEQYVGAIKLANWDPQTVGKQPLFYSMAKTIFSDYLQA